MNDSNIIILSGDSLRYDRAMDDNVMPYLASTAETATNFQNAVSNAGFTPGSFPSLMASRYPSSIDGVGIPEDGGVTTLAEELSQAGYDCGVWSDNKFVGADYNYDRGYGTGQSYEDNLRDNVRKYVDEDGLLFELLEKGYMHVWQRVKNALTESHYYATAEEINKWAKTWLADKDPEEDSVHLWLHYMDSHHPYEPPADWMPDGLEVVSNRTEANNVTRRVCQDDGVGCSDAEVRDAVRLYDAECQYLDSQIEAFVENFLEPNGWFTDDDVLVVTSDHGEIIEEYDKWGEFGHGNFFNEECTRIPLVIDAPSLDSKTVDSQVSLIDLMPTLLDLVGVEVSADELVMGESLINVVAGDERRETIFYDGTLGFHGARSEDGVKRFNTEYVGEDTYLDTEFKAALDGDYDETLVKGGLGHDRLGAFVTERLDECATLSDESTAIDPDSVQVKQHMKDLGYLK
ncbi:sulfatase [Natrinema gelatinilyticum]|uniref:sulfatase n=1 Tax=Natrinema gelatinilyticum TaxID=2961571 RepID=UPI0020C1EC94|nr:sulfatase [Natrinema gelatinilyticum]